MALSDYITSEPNWNTETLSHLFDIDGATYRIDDVCGELKLFFVPPKGDVSEWVKPDNTPMIRRRGVEVDMSDPMNKAIEKRCVDTLIRMYYVTANRDIHKIKQQAFWKTARG
tara:strand:- start:807 stop:1145 length:339 start_codon:yes stop_codon:yes gene_type:complete